MEEPRNPSERPALGLTDSGFPDRLMLGIESSCDDTSIALLRGNVLLAQFTAAQHIHAKYGGVVPEFASQAHQRHILPVLEGALEQADCTLQDVEEVAYTRERGLNGSLLVGSALHAASLGLWIFHFGRFTTCRHLLAHWMDDATAPRQPMMALTVSGGHTQLVDVRSPGELEVVGTTLDDAAGEAFDKVAKLVGLPYPGGPEVDRLAREGNPEAYSFATPKVGGLDFNFSGRRHPCSDTRKTRCRHHRSETGLRDLCASVQATIVRMLVDRLEEAALARGRQAIAIQGGVSAIQGCGAVNPGTGKRVGRSHPPIPVLHRQWGHDRHQRPVGCDGRGARGIGGRTLAEVADGGLQALTGTMAARCSVRGIQ